MAKFCLYIVLLSLLIQFTYSIDSPASAPAPSLGADSPISPETGSPFISPASSPPAPPPSDLESSPAPAPAPASELSRSTSSVPVPAPAPEPVEASDMSHSDLNANGESGEGSSSGARKKAGIVVGVIVGACLVVFGGIVYKKRKDNIRRSEYGYAARREIL